MCVIDWKSTCGSPIECSRKRSKDRAPTAPASIGPPCRVRREGANLQPGRRVVNPAAADHRRHDLDLGQLLRLEGERVAVEDDEIGQIAGHEAAATALVAREPRGG